MANLIGQNLGPYRIIEQIGLGGMATVYKAYQPSMDRYVAVKVLPAHFMQDPAFVERFEREARTIAKLEHPHILPVFDYGQTTGGITYIAMRYVEAGTLADLLAQKTPPLEEAFRLFNQMADALAYAHEQGVVHRDIKPSNMLVDSRGQIFLTDFGLARMIEGSSNLTGSMILGTPAYMAPELGEGQPADKLSDIYALGVVLYELATGRPPFQAETPMAVMLKHMTEPLPLPRQLNPAIPEALEQIILKALAKNPADRYPDIPAMMAALRKMPAPPPLTAPPPSAATAIPQKKFPAWGRWAIAGLGIALLTGAAILFLIPSNDEESPPPPAPATVIAARPQTEEATPPSQPTALIPTPPPPTEPKPAAVEAPPGWTLYTNTQNVTALALQDNILWVGTTGGLIAWNYHDYQYQKLTVSDGLPYHNITALLVDADNILWAGTDSAGVLRYDGQTWQQFTEEEGLASNSVLSLFQTDEGRVIAGTAYGDEGLSFYDDGQWQPIPIPDDVIETPSPIAILETSRHELLAGLADGDGLLYSPDGENWTNLAAADNLPAVGLMSMALDSDENLWLATEKHGVGLYDGRTFHPVEQLADTLVTTLYTAPDGTMWLGAAEQTLLAFDGNELQRYGEKDGLPEGPITRILQDDEGILWLGMEGSGLVRFDGKTFEQWAVAGEPAFNRAQQILETADGRLWFVDQWGGDTIAVYDPRRNTWKTYTPPAETYALAVEPDGTMWFGTDNGLWRVAPSGGQKHFTVEDGLPGNAATALTIDGRGGLWVGTKTGVAYHNPADTDTPWRNYTDAVSGAYIQMLYTDPTGEVWIGTQGDDEQSAGLAWAADTVYGAWGAGNPFPEDMEIIEAAAMDSEGRLWVGTWGGNAVWRLAEKSQAGEWRRFSADDGAPESEIMTIVAQPDGPVWFGTWYNGLWNFHPVDGWQRITPRDGLPGMAVFAMRYASDGSLWVSTEGGIGRYKPE